MRPTVAKPDLDIRVLRQFLAVSEAGSMTRAAEQLNVAQPALSQQIQRLERNLQKTLFERHARGVQLTAAGEALAVHARDILAVVDRARTELVGTSGGVSGTVVIGLPMSAAELFALDFIELAQQRHPALRILLHDRSSEEVNSLLLAGKLDLALTFYRPEANWVDAKPLYEEALAFAIPPSLGASAPIPIPIPITRRAQMRRLGEVPLALPTRIHGLRQTLEQAASEAGVSLDVRFEFESIHLLREAVGRGLAASVLPMSLLAAFMPKKQLQIARLMAPAFNRTLYIASSRRRPLSAALSAARTLLEETALAAIVRAPIRAFYRKA